MEKISKSEKKVLTMWVIAGLLLFLIVLIIKVDKVIKGKDNPTTPGTSLINDRSRYFTVKNAINKYYSYVNDKDYDAVLKILNSDYIKNNNITKENVNSILTENPSYLSYDTGIMCLKASKKGIYIYVVEGYEEEMNTGKKLEDKYYEVVLDGNTFLYNITPIDKETYGGVCNG